MSSAGHRWFTGLVIMLAVALATGIALAMPAHANAASKQVWVVTGAKLSTGESYSSGAYVFTYKNGLLAKSAWKSGSGERAVDCWSYDGAAGYKKWHIDYANGLGEKSKIKYVLKYDKGGRVASYAEAQYADSPTKLAYDAKGRCKKSGFEKVSYNAKGRVSKTKASGQSLALKRDSKGAIVKAKGTGYLAGTDKLSNAYSSGRLSSWARTGSSGEVAGSLVWKRVSVPAANVTGVKVQQAWIVDMVQLGRAPLALVAVDVRSASSSTSKPKSSPRKSSAVKLTSSNTKLSVSDVTFTGKKLTPNVTVKYRGKKLKKGTHYSVSYSHNVDVGKAKVTVTGKGTYKGTVKGSFRVKAAKAYLLAFGGAKGESPTSTQNVSAVYNAISNLKIPGYHFAKAVKKNYKGFTKKRLLDAVDAACAKATSNDISFIYINTHGKAREKNAQGDLEFPGIATGGGYDDHYAWSDVLKNIGSHVKGKIVLLTEVCYSGNLVAKAGKSKVSDRIAIISAASTTMPAHQIDTAYFNKIVIGKGTYRQALVNGLSKRYAASVDKNNDAKVTLGELGTYIINDKGVKATGQGPMVYYGGSLKKLVLYKR